MVRSWERCQNHSARKYWLPPTHLVNSGARVPKRLIRLTERFFDRLDIILPSERRADETPSVTDLFEASSRGLSVLRKISVYLPKAPGLGQPAVGISDLNRRGDPLVEHRLLCHTAAA